MKRTIIGLACLILPTIVACVRNPVQDLPEWKDKTLQEMSKQFGKPAEEYSYTIPKAPTKNWNHGIIFSVYPKDKPENQDVVIKEYAWTDGDYRIRACCHKIKDEWRVMGAMRIHKDVSF